MRPNASKRLVSTVARAVVVRADSIPDNAIHTIMSIGSIDDRPPTSTLDDPARVPLDGKLDMPAGGSFTFGFEDLTSAKDGIEISPLVCPDPSCDFGLGLTLDDGELTPAQRAIADDELMEIQADFRDRTNGERHTTSQRVRLVGDGEEVSLLGGTVTVSTTIPRPDWVAVSVADEGVGIPAADLDRIFSLYYTTKPDGNGIGLSVVFRTVQMHDGHIDVASEPGRGTTMTVRLPLRT